MNPQPSPAEDPLEAILRKSSAPIADAGFSARVLNTLPPPLPNPRLKLNRRFIACSLGATTGLIWSLAISGPQRALGLSRLITDLETSFATIANTLSEPTVLMLGTLTLVSLAFAFSREITATIESQINR